MISFISKFIKNMFGTQNERELRKIEELVRETNEEGKELSSFSDEEIKEEARRLKEEITLVSDQAETEAQKLRESITLATSDQERGKLKKKLKDIKNNAVDNKLTRVFAVVREASKRTIGLRHFDVQLLGGIVLHQGKIAEMTTGEGKTLVATLPACLNAFSGRSVHVVTVNDYLAKRDSEWMGPVYRFLGLTVGVIQNDMRPEERKAVYDCDLVYGTNNEFGFDYLRDNMVSESADIVQSRPNFAIVDEVDSILIDEARTPLIISGPVDETNESYNQMRPVVEEIVKAQNKCIRDYLSKFQERFKSDKKDEEAGKFLYLIHKGDPKNRDFLNLVLKDMNAKTLLDRMQSLFDSKTMEKERAEFLEELFYVFDEKSREISFSANGLEMMREKFDLDFVLDDIEVKISELANENISDEEKMEKETMLVTAYSEKQKKVESTNQLLKAYKLFEKDVDYVINENKIVIVDGFTGRMMPGRRFSDGIHEALEAKERVEVQRESQTLATITLQNYFRMYDKLAGMTGTAKTEESEFENIYQLPVVQIPTNRPLKRLNMPDRIYKTEHEKFNAVADEVAHLNEKGRPVLVGTISIEKSERISKLLNSRGIRHNVLNAKYHENEAHIIAQAGRYKGVTIATNMAGRGTDIILGGNAEELARSEMVKLEINDPDEKKEVYEKFHEEFQIKTVEGHKMVIEAGGLHIIGTERHESRRIDNQLRGRSGRQGDAGSSRFYLSLEDDLMRIFGSDRIKMIMDKLGMEEGEVIENPLVTRAVRTAQHRVEGQNFEIRKHLLKYDNVMNQQREVIYKKRRMVLSGSNLKQELLECLNVGLESLLGNWEHDPDEKNLAKQIMYRYALNVNPEVFIGLSAQGVVDEVMDVAEKSYSSREKFIGEEKIRRLEKIVMLSVIDSNWKEYLREIDELREGISWRAYAQKDPLVEFQHEAFRMFTELIIKIDEEIAERIIKISVMEEKQKKEVFNIKSESFEHKGYSAIGMSSVGQDVVYDSESQGSSESPVLGSREDRKSTYKRDEVKIGRNDPCSCGSGKKYKKCCGR
ncbi:MAG: preprotein translocase subunit SecA [Candidatus Omnitrophica bacterium]|nr:preprotein translocase subunit SecA [Candidatus Omnitrophota bacterium]